MKRCYIIIFMRCLSCESFSLSIICSKCQNSLLKPSFYKRKLLKDFFVYSFYEYETIKEFINTKYEFYGDRVFSILAKLSFKKFGKNFDSNEQIYSIAIDDVVRKDFSHSAILSKHLKSKYILPINNTLRASNVVKYAGKDLKFRKNNKRKFIYSGKKNLKVILVDDLITTGNTILEAKECLEKNNCDVLFALTLCNVDLN